MKLGAQFLAEDFHDCMESVAAAERAGFAHAWFVDSQILWQDCYVYMARALELTDRIALGTAVSNPYTRHPTVTASVNATLAELYPGRVILGLGRGDSAVRTMGMNPVPTKELRAAVPVIRALMAGETTQINDADVHFRWHKEGTEVPIALSATGPKNLRAAGGLADIVMIYVGVHPENVAWAIDHIRAGAKEAGRNADSVKVSVLCGLEVNDDRGAAQETVRWAAAACANHIGDTMKRNPEHGMPETMTRLVDARTQHYDYYEGHLDSSADHTGFLTPKLIDDFAIAGPADYCLEKIQALADLGVWEVSSAYYNGRDDQLARVGSDIISKLSG